MLYFLIILLIVIGDQLTKLLIINTFELYEMLEVIPGFFNLAYTVNKGAAFSIFAGFDSIWRHVFFLVIGLTAIIGLTVYNFKIQNENRVYSFALACICGGAIGNLIDRMRLGHVVDFLDVYIGKYHWPTFNVADSAIVIGVGLFLLINLRPGGGESDHPSKKE